MGINTKAGYTNVTSGIPTAVITRSAYAMICAALSAFPRWAT